MIFAAIPWHERFNDNRMFDVDSEVNKNGLTEPYAAMKRYLEHNGHEINTVDLYDDLKEVDFFLFFDWFPEWIVKLERLGLEARMVYCNGEPPTVRALNTPEGYEKVRRYFPYIMTWNKDLIDNESFFWRTIPYNFIISPNDTPYESKKLLTSISANKRSDYKDELYTEREKLISYFEEAMPEQFDMYGVGWDKKKHPSYCGCPESKAETYAGYKFALALENTKNVRGYVTEKIFDCLTSGIVPVYYGADDICEYVPEDCFVDYRKFKTPEHLAEYLLSVDKEQYDLFVKAGQKCVSSKELQYRFSGELYAQNIMDMVKASSRKDFSIRLFDKLYMEMMVLKSKLIIGLKSIIKGMI